MTARAAVEPTRFKPAHIESMLAVTRVVARGGSLNAILDNVASEVASTLEGGCATSILILSSPHGPMRLGGSAGVSQSYREMLDRPATRLRSGFGPSGIAVQQGAPVIIEDTQTDPRITAWSPFALREGFRSQVSIPLQVDDRIVGTLNAYRHVAGPWPSADLEHLAFVADHAANAVRTALMIDQSQQEVVALRRIVRSLREQTHEHANRLHAAQGLLALGEVAEAQGFLAGIQAQTESARDIVTNHVGPPVLAGLLLAEAAIAAQRNIVLEFHPGCDIAALPANISDAQAVTILGNLLDNAFDAVAEMSNGRRRVQVLLVRDRTCTRFQVRDWGPGMHPDLEDPFARGLTTKAEHAGVGLSLLLDAAASSVGRVEVDSHPDGTTFTVEIPS